MELLGPKVPAAQGRHALLCIAAADPSGVVGTRAKQDSPIGSSAAFPAVTHPCHHAKALAGSSQVADGRAALQWVHQFSENSTRWEPGAKMIRGSHA